MKLKINELQGTNNPACAIITDIPIYLIKLVLPTAFVPYNNKPLMLLPISKSLVIYNSLVLICSINGCLIPVKLIYDFIDSLSIMGLQ